jgi:hypothetical protein
MLTLGVVLGCVWTAVCVLSAGVCIGIERERARCLGIVDKQHSLDGLTAGLLARISTAIRDDGT